MNGIGYKVQRPRKILQVKIEKRTTWMFPDKFLIIENLKFLLSEIRLILSFKSL